MLEDVEQPCADAGLSLCEEVFGLWPINRILFQEGICLGQVPFGFRALHSHGVADGVKARQARDGHNTF